MSSACGHSKTLCRKCGSVVMQCRCMSKDKRIEYVEGCDDCRRPEPPKPGSMAQYNADLAKVLDKFPDEYHTRPGMSGQPYTRLTEDHQIFDPKNPPTKRTQRGPSFERDNSECSRSSVKVRRPLGWQTPPPAMSSSSAVSSVLGR